MPAGGAPDLPPNGGTNVSEDPERRPTYMGHVCEPHDIEVTFEAPEIDEPYSVRLVFHTYVGTFELKVDERAFWRLAARVIVRLAEPDVGPPQA